MIRFFIFKLFFGYSRRNEHTDQLAEGVVLIRRKSLNSCRWRRTWVKSRAISCLLVRRSALSSLMNKPTDKRLINFATAITNFFSSQSSAKFYTKFQFFCLIKAPEQYLYELEQNENLDFNCCYFLHFQFATNLWIHTLDVSYSICLKSWWLGIFCHFSN